MKRPLKRGDVYWVNLDPTVGSEIRKARPAIIISPDDFNHNLPRVIIAPLTTKGAPLGCRPFVRFKRKNALILLDQIRAVDKSRLVSREGEISTEVWLPILIEMFE